MKLLVFAHTPPPHHGQSYMVQLMLAGLGGDRRHEGAPSGVEGDGLPPAVPGGYGIECYHVNARLSRHLEDIGDLRVGKFFLLLGYCLQAIWCRFRYGVTNFYYIPAPGKRSAVYRDWMVMALCRPFFKRFILHWHAAGLAKWLETAVQMRWRVLTYRAMKQPDLSIVLSRYNRADAEKIFSQRIRVVSNGIPDPCPDFAQQVLPQRRARFNVRQALLAGGAPNPGDSAQAGLEPTRLRVLYLAHCTREKGLFDALAGVELANQRLAESGAPVSMRLLVAGTFVNAEETAEFERFASRAGAEDRIQYLGFVSGERKHQLLREADLFCFPTYYQNENQPVNLLEAMAFGLPIVTTRWRSLPELFPASYAGLVDVRSPEQIAAAMLALMGHEGGADFRNIFLRNFTFQSHAAGLAEAFHSVELPVPAGAAQPAAHVPPRH